MRQRPRKGCFMAQKTKTDSNTGKRTNQKSKSKKPDYSVIVIVGIALVLYVTVNFIYAQFTKIVTEAAQKVTISDTISSVGYAVRDETIIKSQYSGVTVSIVENGGRVYKGETVVNVFDSEASAQAYLRILEIDKALEEFENMKTAGEENATALDSIEKILNNNLLSFSGSLYCGDVAQALELADDILYNLNKSQIATKQVENFDLRIAELEAERSALQSQLTQKPETLKSPMPGYFISEVDGYEGLLNSAVLEGLTPEMFESIISGHSNIVDSSVIGKIADNYKWNMVCVVAAEEASRLEEGKFYNIRLPYSEIDKIEVKLNTITPSADESECLLVFSCSYMISDLASFRSQPIIIEVKNFTGLGIRQESIVYQNVTTEVSSSDGMVMTQTESIPGVYILWGNEVRFRRINEIYRDGDTVVCSIESARGWLKMYDNVIINKENMYDGKIVNIT